MIMVMIMMIMMILIVTINYDGLAGRISGSVRMSLGMRKRRTQHARSLPHPSLGRLLLYLCSQGALLPGYGRQITRYGPGGLGNYR